MMNSRRSTKADRELGSENRDVRFKFPFPYSTSNSRPVDSRFLMTIRTKNDFNDPDKLSPDNTVEAILEKERIKNPYATNKNDRKKTLGRYHDNENVIKMKQ